MLAIYIDPLSQGVSWRGLFFPLIWGPIPCLSPYLGPYVLSLFLSAAQEVFDAVQVEVQGEAKCLVKRIA